MRLKPRGTFIDLHDGDRVNVTFASGTTIEGITERVNGMYRLNLADSIAFYVNLNEPYDDSFLEYVTDVERLTNEADMLRITRLRDVQIGDLVVCRNLRGRAVKIIDHERIKIRSGVFLDIEGSTANEGFIRADAFQYALREKPKLPTESGFYRGNDGNDYAFVFKQGEGFFVRQLTEDGKPAVKAVCFISASGNGADDVEKRLIEANAPYERIEFALAKEEL